MHYYVPNPDMYSSLIVSKNQFKPYEHIKQMSQEVKKLRMN